MDLFNLLPVIFSVFTSDTTPPKQHADVAPLIGEIEKRLNDEIERKFFVEEKSDFQTRLLGQDPVAATPKFLGDDGIDPQIYSLPVDGSK